MFVKCLGAVCLLLALTTVTSSAESKQRCFLDADPSGYLRLLEHSSFRSCDAACRVTPICRKFSFVSETLLCCLYDKLTRIEEEEGHVSSAQTCETPSLGACYNKVCNYDEYCDIDRKFRPRCIKLSSIPRSKVSTSTSRNNENPRDIPGGKRFQPSRDVNQRIAFPPKEESESTSLIAQEQNAPKDVPKSKGKSGKTKCKPINISCQNDSDSSALESLVPSATLKTFGILKDSLKSLARTVINNIKRPVCDRSNQMHNFSLSWPCEPSAGSEFTIVGSVPEQAFLDVHFFNNRLRLVRLLWTNNTLNINLNGHNMPTKRFVMKPAFNITLALGEDDYVVNADGHQLFEFLHYRGLNMSWWTRRGTDRHQRNTYGIEIVEGFRRGKPEDLKGSCMGVWCQCVWLHACRCNYSTRSRTIRWIR